MNPIHEPEDEREKRENKSLSLSLSIQIGEEEDETPRKRRKKYLIGFMEIFIFGNLNDVHLGHLTFSHGRIKSRGSFLFGDVVTFYWSVMGDI